jgi:hypothetical protein
MEDKAKGKVLTKKKLRRSHEDGKAEPSEAIQS